MKTIKLREKKNKKSITFYFDTYENGRRSKETLPFKAPISKDPASKALAKEARLAASMLLSKRNIDNLNGITQKKMSSNISVKEYFKEYQEKYDKKDLRNIKGVCNIFIKILISINIEEIQMRELKEEHIIKLKDFLIKNHRGEGPASYFARLKKVLKTAVKEKVIIEDPSSNVTIKRKTGVTKEVLTETEINTLFNTDLSNKMVKNAFIFSSNTGLRWVDIKELKFKHLDYKNHRLKKTQSKTEIELDVPVKEDQFKYILPPKGFDDEYVFKLPSSNSANKILRNWCKKAGINKHITWHCARHSFATIGNALNTDQFTMMKMMGLASTKYLTRYTKVSDELKQRFVDKKASLFVI